MYGGFLLPEKYILLKGTKKDTLDFPRKSEVYFFRKKIFQFCKKISGIFFSIKRFSRFFKKI